MITAIHTMRVHTYTYPYNLINKHPDKTSSTANPTRVCMCDTTIHSPGSRRLSGFDTGVHTCAGGVATSPLLASTRSTAVRTKTGCRVAENDASRYIGPIPAVVRSNSAMSSLYTSAPHSSTTRRSSRRTSPRRRSTSLMGLPYTIRARGVLSGVNTGRGARRGTNAARGVCPYTGHGSDDSCGSKSGSEMHWQRAGQLRGAASGSANAATASGNTSTTAESACRIGRDGRWLNTGDFAPGKYTRRATAGRDPV